ncbi:sugar ABC transporter permease [Glycomyces luteolus]|uniref:Sugar ABC transporter permease n=1 Tax=Glycomyces luteolus TaxID=2670330 RepID=A0A9X3SPS6_9ACTN|nr:sugar ABC transporter permease [Glycomyces luteolus]MDA1358229.1 sugar ABC transporter permease [Glycomyces luteolus]
MGSTLAPPRPAPHLQSAPRPTRLQRLRRRGVESYLFTLPVIVVFVVLFAIPLAQSFYYSLTDFNGYSTEANFVGFENYTTIWRDTSMLSALGFTLVFTVGTTVAITVLAIPLALVLNRKFFGRNLVRSVFFFPSVVSVAILGLVWGFIFAPLGTGVINSIIGWFGAQPIAWLAEPDLARISVVVVAVWGGTGWHAVLYLAYLQAIPSEFYEAASIDGASRRQQFRYVTLPLLTPAITVSQLLLITGGLKVYDLPYTLTGGGPGFATRTLTQSIIENGIAQGEAGKASALSVVFFVAVGLIIVAQLALSRRMEARFS